MFGTGSPTSFSSHVVYDNSDAKDKGKGVGERKAASVEANLPMCKKMGVECARAKVAFIGSD
jgi:hypothetical protein